ncbi:MAG: DUF4129 domain-containing protein [Desulfobacterales bacterium]|nr:DUF4129 domain-containing protein [Desulfobacterales bacterium]
MTRKHNLLITAAGAGMELCWLYAWAAFLMFALYGRTWPPALTAGVFGLAAAAAAMFSDKKYSRAGLISRRASLFVVGLAVVLFWFSDLPLEFRSLALFFESWLRAAGPGRVFFLLFLLALTLVIWKRGARLLSDPLTSKNVHARFDLGLAAFFALFIVKTLASIRGGVDGSRPETTLVFFSFFLFSLLSIGAMRRAGGGRKDYISGFQKLGVVLSFSVVILFLGAGLIALFYSDLVAGAEILSGGLKKAAAPLAPLLKTTIGFLMMYDAPATEGASLFPENDSSMFNAPGGAAQSPGIFPEILKWLPAALVLVITFLIICTVTGFLIKVLFFKTDSGEKGRRGRYFVSGWLALKNFLASCRAGVRRWIRGCADGVELYAALTTWGRRGGVSRRPVETPREYGFRLVTAFPGLGKEIDLIVELFNRELYGELVLDKSEMGAGRRALKELKRVAYLPLRIKTWLFPNGGPGNSLNR